jgi:hypothetical protein
VGVEHGTGRHWWVLEEDDRNTAMRVSLAAARANIDSVLCWYTLLTKLSTGGTATSGIVCP